MVVYPPGKLVVWIYVCLLYTVGHIEATSCGIPDEVENAELEEDIGTKDTFEEGTVLKYDCKRAYRSSTSQIRMCEGGQWTTPFECTRINCGRIEHPRHGRRLGDTFFVGDRLNFRCDEGYERIGTADMLCRANGEWRPKNPPICSLVRCRENIEHVPNGDSFQESLDGVRNVFMKVVSFSCDYGYDLIGSQTRTCQADGTWSGTQPRCIPPSCPDFEDLAGGTIYYQDEDINRVTHIAIIECNKNFDLFPDIPDGFNECLDKNKWEYPEFTCEERLEVGPGRYMQLYRGKRKSRRRQIKSPVVLKSRTQLLSECFNRYEMYDEVTNAYLNARNQAFRVMNGKLEPPMAICKEARCELRQCSCTYADANNEELSGKVDHGTRVTKSCNSRQEFEPENQRTLEGITHTCDRGRLSNFPRCINKRSKIPEGRVAYLKRERLDAGRLVHHGETVYLRCVKEQELYNPIDGTYLERDRFESRSNYGTWTNPIFPICKNKRCRVPKNRNTNSFYSLNNGQNMQNQKVEHGTELEKRCGNNYEDIDKERVICEKGNLRGASPCTPRRSVVPDGRFAYLNEETLHGGKFVEHDQTVYVICGDDQELYNPDDDTYLDIERFESRSNYGRWTNPTFPICKNKRCTVPEHEGTAFYTVDNRPVVANQKVEHDTELKKRCGDKYEDRNQTKVICERGNLRGSNACTPRGCVIPDGRTAQLRERSREKLYEGRHVDHDQTVAVLGNGTHELYFPNNDTYYDSDRFESTCEFGSWTNPTFPVEIIRRCKVPNYVGTSFYSLGNDSIAPNHMVAHGTQIEKRCDDKFEDLDKMTVVCEKGTLEGGSQCTPKRCVVGVDRGVIDSNGKEYLTKHTVPHNTTLVNMKCGPYRELQFTDNKRYVKGFRSTCNYGQWTAAFPECVNKRCLIPNFPGTNFLHGNKTVNPGVNVDSGEHLERNCDLGYIEEGRRNVRCNSGKLKGFEPCSAESCIIPVIENSQDQQTEISHDEEITIACTDGFYLLRSGNLVSDAGIQVKCNLGNLTEDLDGLTCESRCRIEPSDGTSYGYLNDTHLESTTLVVDSTKLKIMCEDNYTLYYKETTRGQQNGTVTCINGTIQPDYKCISKISDEVPDRSVDDATEAPLADEDDYYYDAYGEDEDEDEPENDVECSAPTNGNFRRSFLKYYEVWCNEGYTLNTRPQNARKFTCEDGKLQSYILKKEPICKEDSCDYTTDMSRKMEVYARKRGENIVYSEGFKFEVGKRLFFNCKEKDKEPVKRVFKCSRGHWVSIQPGFDMKINNTHPDCREANCGEGCKFGGTCVRDGQCSCPPGTGGDNCENPVCSEQCIQNGECIGPYQCKCELPRYGTDCEAVGCDLPEVDDEASFRDVRTLFRQDDILLNSDITCQEGYILSTQNDFVCIGNNTWSEEVNCLEGTKYTIEFKVRDERYWRIYPGSWCPMVVTMLNSEGNVIGEFSFPDGKFPGKTYNATKWMEYIGKVVRVNIALTPHNGRYDDIKMDYIRISGEDDRRYEEYRLNNVESSRSWIFSPKLETGCIRPSFNGKYLRGEKKVYFNGDTISSSDIECNAGLEPTLNSITCQQNGQWTGTLSCSPRPELVTGLTVISSSTHTSKQNGVSIPWGPELAVDGIQTRAPNKCNCCAATNIQYEPWYKVDLGRQYDLQRVSVLGRGGDGDHGYGQFLKNMKITYGINQYAETELVFTTDDVYTLELSLSEPKRARYLELKLVEISQYFVICELQVYAFHVSRTGLTPQPTLSQDNSDESSVETEEYEIGIHSEHSTQSAVYVIIQGNGENSGELLFSETGLNKGLSSKTIEPIPKIENIMTMRIKQRRGWFNNHIAYLRGLKSSDEYIGFLDSPKKTQADIQLHELFQLDCKGKEYTPGQRGYSSGDSQTIARQKVTTEEECKSLCSENESCKAVYVQKERSSIHCKCLRTNKLSSFVFDNSYFKGTIYFRKC